MFARSMKGYVPRLKFFLGASGIIRKSPRSLSRTCHSALQSEQSVDRRSSREWQNRDRSDPTSEGNFISLERDRGRFSVIVRETARQRKNTNTPRAICELAARIVFCRALVLIDNRTICEREALLMLIDNRFALTVSQLIPSLWRYTHTRYTRPVANYPSITHPAGYYEADCATSR